MLIKLFLTNQNIYMVFSTNYQFAIAVLKNTVIFLFVIMSYGLIIECQFHFRNSQ